MNVRAYVAAAVTMAAASTTGAQGPRPSPLPSQPMLISDVTLIDGTDAPPEPHMSILIRDGRIATVAAAGEAPPATSVRVIDGRGSYVIPGLIDGHVHLTGRDWQARVTQLEAALRGGVTAVFELAGDTRITGDLARAVLTHEISGPTIYYSAVMAGPPFFTDPRVIAISRGYVPGTAPWAQAISAQTDMTQAIAAARGTGATMIKLYASLDSATVVRATAEAHRQRMHVVAHATTFPARPSDLVDAGVDMLAHTAYLVWNGTPRTPDWTKRASGDFIGVPANSPAIEHLLISMRDHHVALNPTLWVFDESQPADSLVRVRQAWTDAVTKRALDLGVTIVAGTDEMLNPRQDSLPTIHRELQLEVRAGLTPLQAIRSATLNAARTIGVDSIRGTIAPGRVADLVLLDANPAEDIANTRRIRMVIKDGQVVDRSVRVPITRDR